MIESGYDNRDGIGEVDQRVSDGKIDLTGLSQNNDGSSELVFYSDIHGPVVYMSEQGNFAFDVKGRLWVYDSEWNKALASVEAELLAFLKERSFQVEVIEGVVYAISPMMY